MPLLPSIHAPCVLVCKCGFYHLCPIFTPLIYVTGELLKGMDEKSIFLLVLLDMSKAFDSLNHNVLLNRLRSLGLTSHCLSWFSSYLSDRKQRVRYGDAVSQTLL